MDKRAAVLAALVAAVTVTACAPTDHRVVLKALRTQLAGQYHECVPLGWSPVPVAKTYYPGASVELEQQEVWLRALWLARINRRDLKRPEVRATAEVLDQLVRLQMVSKEHLPRGDMYRLTLRAMPYYYEDNHFGNNLSGSSYLCYSSIEPQRIVWSDGVHGERRGKDEVRVFRAGFEWSATPAALWAGDPFIRSHSVILSPVSNPVVATFVERDGEWLVEQLHATEAPLPRVVDASVWPHLRS